MSSTTEMPPNVTAVVEAKIYEITWQKIIVASILYAITLATIVGNVIVLIAVKMDKKLQTTFNYYIVNLAITDVGVAITAMSFMATHTVLGYWPFGEVLCAVWIFFDYGMTFVSVFTLLLISLDRFWSVTWSIHYRQHHTKKKCLVAIVSVWLFMLALWFPPWLVDRVRNSQPDMCYWDPSQNQEFVYIVAVFGHHGPYCVMVACYIHIFIFMRKRTKVTATANTNRPAIHIAATSSSEYSGMPNVESNRPSIRTEVFSIKECTNDPKSTSFTSNTFLKVPSTRGSRRQVQSVENRAAREKRVFITLTYILVAYGILWLPFHIIFDISIVDPTLVPEHVLNLSFWMAYFNSTINPFLYNFSSPEFRVAFQRMFKRVGTCR